MTIVRDAPNVLTLDYVDVTVDGETQTGQYFYAAAQAAFEESAGGAAQTVDGRPTVPQTSKAVTSIAYVPDSNLLLPQTLDMRVLCPRAGALG